MYSYWRPSTSTLLLIAVFSLGVVQRYFSEDLTQLHIKVVTFFFGLVGGYNDALMTGA